MNVPKVDIKQLLEAGVHLGHKTLRWNPKMKKFIFGEKELYTYHRFNSNSRFLKNALMQVHKVIAGGKLLLSQLKNKLQNRLVTLLKRRVNIMSTIDGLEEC